MDYDALWWKPRYFGNHEAAFPSSNRINMKYRYMECPDSMGGWESDSNSGKSEKIQSGGRKLDRKDSLRKRCCFSLIVKKKAPSTHKKLN